MNKFIKTTGAALCLAGVKSSNIHELTFHERPKIAPNNLIPSVMSAFPTKCTELDCY